MKSRRLRKGFLALCAAGATLGALMVSPLGASAAGPSYSIATLPKYGGEPSIWSDSTGVLYDTTPSGGTVLFRSSDMGATWLQRATANASSGDDSVATDQTNNVYESDLAACGSTLPLEACVYKATAATIGTSQCNVGSTTCWLYGNGINPGGTNCGGACSPFGVDREWADAWVPPAGGSTWCTPGPSCAVLFYHDFYGPSSVWVNISHDGGATYSAPMNILSSINASTNPAVAAAVIADTACNTIPAGALIDKTGLHPGRIYVSWIAADPIQNGINPGCNITMLQAFHNLIVAWSDDGGGSWMLSLAFDAGQFHDASGLFAAFALDNQGNPYLGFVANSVGQLPTTTGTCAGLSTAGMVQGHPECESDMYVVWSADGGTTWDGGGGLVPGSAAAPYKVNPDSEVGTHWFPAIAAGNPGQVDVGYLYTTEIQPTDQSGKADFGACAGPGQGAPVTTPAACKWDLYAGQSLNLTNPPATATWTTENLTSPSPAAPGTNAMHVGDICNLGIFCMRNLGSNRHLADFNSATIDPTTGCAHIAYADDNSVNKLRVANQSSGPNILGLATGPCSGLGTSIPEVSLPALFLPAGVAVGIAGWRLRRRRLLGNPR